MIFGEKLRVLSHARLRELLDYDPATGVFVWKVNRNSYGGKIKIGVVAGLIDRYGHREIGIDRYRYMAHRLAWFYVHEVWPKHEVDHINMVRDDNRLSNLRVVPHRSYQRANQKVRKDSHSGLKGAQKTKDGRWRSRITKHGVVQWLGVYDTPEEAHAAYCKAAVIHFGEYARAS